MQFFNRARSSRTRERLRLLRACTCMDLYKKNLVIEDYFMNFSVIFYKDPTFCLGEIQLLVKVEVNGLKLEKYPKINPPEMHLFW